jgi:hypothetical protein
MNSFLAAAFFCLCSGVAAADVLPAKQIFQQERARHFSEADGFPGGPVQLLDVMLDGRVRAFAGVWHEFTGEKWKAALGRQTDDFEFSDAEGKPVLVKARRGEVKQLLRFGATNFLATTKEVYSVAGGRTQLLALPEGQKVNQLAVSRDGKLFLASSGGLFEREADGWRQVRIADELGRAWAVGDTLGVTFDSNGWLWFATRAGVGRESAEGWQFYEGKDGLPWNQFTGLAAGLNGEIWFGTELGAIRFDGREWHYRQGQRWLPHDHVTQVAVDDQGRAWFATAGGLGRIERHQMTLAEKADFYEAEIERYIKRTRFGYVAEARLGRAGEKASADPQDSDNDGLWTAMYGAGQCFAYAATKDPKAGTRARQAFEALRFLQKVTQGGLHSPPHGYIARTIRPSDWPDPNIGRLEHDREARKRDALWKVYEPRWPRSADGHWFWKSDTSSDELDGHYFFYPLYYGFCAETDAERERVREVVRDVTDHLLAHNYVLIDHDGQPTRWAIFGPQYLNRDPNWWPERGLNSLSVLSYLAVAAHVTGDPKYEEASRELIERHGYAMNAMYPKVQQGPGSGNQSDDEMAFMCYYSLLRYSKDEKLKALVRFSFFRYWIIEAPEMNPFFNFAYAAQNLDATATNPWGVHSLEPWAGWHENAMATLYGFPLDRLNWAHKNSHRLDIVFLPPVRSRDLDSVDRSGTRGHRVDGRVLPVENRHFNHWNTDPWRLDYGGSGNELASGTVFLLPYYMGLYHGYIEKPE